MIKITINGKKFNGVYSWEDITLRRYCDLAVIPVPDGYREFILADGKFSIDDQKSVDDYVTAAEKITDEQLNEVFPEYYRKVIDCLSDIPSSLVIPKERIIETYEYFFKSFVLSIIYHTPVISYFGTVKDYTPVIVRSFKIGRNRYYLPEVVDILGQEVPLANESIVTYIEASDIFRGMKLSKDDIHKLAHFMAVYCRKRGEEYDEKKVIDRKDLFMSAPMSIVWSIFFCIIRRLPDYMNTSLLFGRLPKTTQESVLAVRTYRSMVQEV